MQSLDRPYMQSEKCAADKIGASYNPFLTFSSLGLQTALQMTNAWFGAVRGLAESGIEHRAIVANFDVQDKLGVARSSTVSANVEACDDLKKISGVGPKLEQVLNSQGIFNYADIAALKGRKLSALEKALGLSGRIKRDDWVGQAQRLMEEQV